MTTVPTDSVWPQLEPVLTRVRKPARYVGGEPNVVTGDHASADSSWLLSYPDAYEVGQPNQGVQILYEILNEQPTTVAERAYAPVDAFNVTLADELARNGRRTGLTFAPEAGTERMRKVINKMVSEADMLRTAETAFANGWRHIKLYFMIGLPTETDEDVLGIAELGLKVLAIGRGYGRKNKVTVSVGGFVPKPHTPFQWAAQDPPTETARKIDLLKKRVASDRNLNLRYHHPEASVLEGVLARGDRRVADAIEQAFSAGARFDGWDEHYDHGLWADAYAAAGIDPSWYTSRERDEAEVFAWDHLDSGLERDWLWSDWMDATREMELEDCRWTPCYDCGVCPGLDLQHQTGHLPVISAGPR